MKLALALLAALLLAPLPAHGQETLPATVRDHLWLFACPPGGDEEYLENAGVRGGSRLTPAEGAHWLGIPNLLFVTQDHTRPKPLWAERKWKAKTTMEQWAISFESLKRVNWSVVGSGGGGGLKKVPDIVSIAKGAEQGGADGITAINTLIGMAVDWRKRKPILGRGIGGLSGPAIKPVALRMVHEISRAVRIPVIGVGGARTAEDVLEFVCAGASAVEVGTAAFVDPAVLVGVVDDLARLLAGANTSIAELRGSLAAPIAAQASHAPTQGACPAPQRGAEGAASR